MNSNDSGRASTRVGPGVALAALQARPAEDVSRREVARGLLGALSLAALSGCASSAASEERAAPSLLGNTAQALSGTDVAWVDTVLGNHGQYSTRTGDLGTNTAATLGSIVVAKGCVTVGDGGGGLFYWDAFGGTDDGGTCIVPNGTVGSSGPCWRRIYEGGLSVRWFGTAGILGYDDAVAIQKAINAAMSRGKIVFFPAGEYILYTPLVLSSNGIRLIGESSFTTHLRKSGADATLVLIKAGAQVCEVSQLHLTPIYNGTAPATTQTGGGAVTFADDAWSVSGTKIHDLFIEDVYRGIVFGSYRTPLAPAVPSIGLSVQQAAVSNVRMTRILATGLYMRFAVNCTVSNCVIEMVPATPGSGVIGVWLDSASEGCIFDSVFALGGEHCWRLSNSYPWTNGINITDRAPSEHRFYSCIGDNGAVTCFYASAGFRILFDGCWASTQSTNSTAAFSIDQAAVYGLTWTNGQMIYLNKNGFLITDPKLVTISNSLFTSWGMAGTGYRAISIQKSIASVPTSFLITNNTFGNGSLADPNFGGNTALGVSISGSGFYKYVITGNMGLAGTALNDAGVLGSGGSKLVTPNL